jgi:hypothetical protein
MLLLIIVLILLFGGGLGYHHGYNNWTGGGISLGTILLVALIFWLLRGRI